MKDYWEDIRINTKGEDSKMKKLLRKITFITMILLISITTFAQEEVIKNVYTEQVGTGILFNEGRSGEIYGGLRWTKFEEDKNGWLTLRLGEGGIRIVSNDNTKEILAIDNHGGIYLNGDVFVNSKKMKMNNNPIYLILFVCIILDLIILIKYKKMKEKLDIYKNMKWFSKNRV